MKYTIKTKRENRRQIRDMLIPLGTVTDNWDNGSFDFRPYDAECLDEMVEKLEELGIEYVLN